MPAEHLVVAGARARGLVRVLLVVGDRQHAAQRAFVDHAEGGEQVEAVLRNWLRPARAPPACRRRAAAAPATPTAGRSCRAPGRPGPGNRRQAAAAAPVGAGQEASVGHAAVHREQRFAQRDLGPQAPAGRLSPSRRAARAPAQAALADEAVGRAAVPRRARRRAARAAATWAWSRTARRRRSRRRRRRWRALPCAAPAAARALGSRPRGNTPPPDNTRMSFPMCRMLRSVPSRRSGPQCVDHRPISACVRHAAQESG
jgi:hypothetical protein